MAEKGRKCQCRPKVQPTPLRGQRPHDRADRAFAQAMKFRHTRQAASNNRDTVGDQCGSCASATPRSQ